MWIFNVFLNSKINSIHCLQRMKDTIECLKVNVNLQRVFTCVAEGESRSRSAVTPSVCPSVGLFVRLSVRLSVCPSVPKSCQRNSSETTDPIMHIGRKFWSLYFCGSYALWNLENTHKWPCHRNSSETTDPIFMKLGM